MIDVARSIGRITYAPEHAAFVRDSFRRSMYDAALDTANYHTEMLNRDLRGRMGTTVVATPAGCPDVLIGWASAIHNSLLFAYVPRMYRGAGIARQMLAWLFQYAGLHGKIKLVYWTAIAQNASDAGFPIEHDWREFNRREQLIRHVRREVEMHP